MVINVELPSQVGSLKFIFQTVLTQTLSLNKIWLSKSGFEKSIKSKVTTLPK